MKNRNSPAPAESRRRFLPAMAVAILGGGAVKVGDGTSAVSAWTGIKTNSVLNQARPLDGAATWKVVKVEPLILRLKNPRRRSALAQSQRGKEPAFQCVDIATAER